MTAGGFATDRPDDAVPEVEEQTRPGVGPQLRSQHRSPFHASHARFVPTEQAGEAPPEGEQGLVVRATRQEGIGQLNLGGGADAPPPPPHPHSDRSVRPPLQKPRRRARPRGGGPPERNRGGGGA